METKEQALKMISGRVDTITQLSTECLEFMYLTGYNDGIEAAATKIKEQYDHYGDEVIKHYKPMWVEEIRKLKK